jgi:hypothetical protein
VDGTTIMVEYGAGTMKEAQAFYAPRSDFSVGGGYVEFDSDESSKTEKVTYARLTTSCIGGTSRTPRPTSLPGAG